MENEIRYSIEKILEMYRIKNKVTLDVIKSIIVEIEDKYRLKFEQKSSDTMNINGKRCCAKYTFRKQFKHQTYPNTLTSFIKILHINCCTDSNGTIVEMTYRQSVCGSYFLRKYTDYDELKYDIIELFDCELQERFRGVE